MNTAANRILILPGDGIGPEVCAVAGRVLESLDGRFGLNLELKEQIIGGAAIDACGEALPEAVLESARASRALLLGAVGGDKWNALPMAQRPESALLRLRKELGLFANLRPFRLYPELVAASPLKPEVLGEVDFIIVRELTGGIYFGEPRGVQKLPSGEREGFNTYRYSEPEIERLAQHAFGLAQQRRGRLCSVDKANVLEVTALWREVFDHIGGDYPDVSLSHLYVDNAAMQLVLNPGQFDVIATGNMFGDILSDEAAVLVGSIGMAPSASLNASRQGLYEPCHGSAPDIAGQDRANPLGTLLSVAMMLRYSLDRNDAAVALEGAVASALELGLRTADIHTPGTRLTGTLEMGRAVLEAVA